MQHIPQKEAARRRPHRALPTRTACVPTPYTDHREYLSMNRMPRLRLCIGGSHVRGKKQRSDAQMRQPIYRVETDEQNASVRPRRIHDLCIEKAHCGIRSHSGLFLCLSMPSPQRSVTPPTDPRDSGRCLRCGAPCCPVSAAAGHGTDHYIPSTSHRHILSHAARP